MVQGNNDPAGHLSIKDYAWTDFFFFKFKLIVSQGTF